MTNRKFIHHDQISQTLIKQLESNKIEPEAYYDTHLGTGYADLYIQNGDTGYIIEAKAQPQTANKTIRQFKKMRNNFFRGSKHEIPHTSIFVLAFSASQGNLEHLEQNLLLYKNITKEIGQVKSVIWFVDRNKICRWHSDKENFTDFKKRVSTDLNITDFSKSRLECPNCGKTYNRKSYFEKHVTTCREDEKIRRLD